MKKKLFIGASTLMIALSLGLTADLQNDFNDLSNLRLDNIEALSQAEQPDTKDCIPAKGWDCIALHPTDPSKDIVLKDHKWK